MKSVIKTIQRLEAIETSIDDICYQINKICGEMELLIHDIEGDIDFYELMENGKLRGGRDLIRKVEQAIDEVKESALFKIDMLEEKRLLLIMALYSFNKISGRN